MVNNMTASHYVRAEVQIPSSLDVGHQVSLGSTLGILSLIYRLVKN